MAEYIERAEVLKHKTLIPGFIGEYVSVRNIIDATAADVVEVKHGRWVFGGDGIVECTRCNETYDANMLPRNYFPNCGARMDGE